MVNFLNFTWDYYEFIIPPVFDEFASPKQITGT